VGYGETLCLLEFTEPVLVRNIIPIAIGLDPHDVEHLYRKVEGAGFYHHKRAMVFALAAVEMACWDLVGKAAGAPLHKLWGGKYRERIEMIAYLFVSDPEKVAAEARHYVDRGFRTIKLKTGVDERSDVPIAKAVREAVGPDIRNRADVNGAWTPGTAKRMISRLAPFDLEYVEQPLVHDDLLGHAQLRRWSPVPIALDESAYTTADVLNIIRAEAADVILLDPHEAGGLWQARKAASICEAAGIPVTLHSGGELGCSTAAYLHLAASTPNMFPAIDGQQHNQADDVVPIPRCSATTTAVSWSPVARGSACLWTRPNLPATRPKRFAKRIWKCNDPNGSQKNPLIDRGPQRSVGPYEVRCGRTT